MSPRLEREAAADDVAEYAVANHIGLRDFSPIRPSIPCQRPPATRAHVVTLSSPRITALCQSAADAQLDAHLDALDRADSLEELSYTDLIDRRDTASDEGDWIGCSDLDHEIKTRKTDAKVALMKCFLSQIGGGVIPTVIGGKLGCMLVSVWLTEAMDTANGTRDAVAMLMDESARAMVLASLAKDYADENAVELLRAGWSA